MSYFIKVQNGNLLKAQQINTPEGSFVAGENEPPKGWQVVEDVPSDVTDIVSNDHRVLSRLEIRLKLLSLGVTSTDVYAAINKCTDDQIEREKLRAYWEDAGEYHRDSPMVEMLIDTMNLDPTIVDELWDKAI